MEKIRTSFGEKVGYGFGDMSSSMFWKIFSYYLPFFYSNIFGLTLDQVALLLVVTRIWDAVSDPMMGVLADRTATKWGKYRPYLLLMAVPFALSGIFLFSTPAASPTVKLVWAYLTYIMMMTVYTGINVPYGAMLGVMTDNSDSKTVLSSYRMFFAYGGSFLALFCWEPLCRLLGGYDAPSGWRNAMIVIATFCLILFLLCFRMTKEKLRTVSKASVVSVLTGVISPLVWSMYADVSDFAENRDGTASTGLIFSSASMAQKFGGAFGGFAVMWLLKAFGYNTTSGAVQTPEAINGLWLLMSWIPAAVAALAVVVIFFYPLTRARMIAIQDELAVKRAREQDDKTEVSDETETSPQIRKGLPKVMRWVMAVLAAILALELIFIILK